VEQLTLINKQRNRINIFKKFKSTLPQAEEVMEIEYPSVYKRSSKPVEYKLYCINHENKVPFEKVIYNLRKRLI